MTRRLTCSFSPLKYRITEIRRRIACRKLEQEMDGKKPVHLKCKLTLTDQ